MVTSVNRDDDNLGGARALALVTKEIRRQAPGCRVEVLIPDFQGNQEAIRTVVEAQPEILNHNTETVPRLYRVARSGARYERSLELLRYAKELRPGGVTKSGVMVGLGEETRELLQVFRDLAAQWLRHPYHWAVPWPGTEYAEGSAEFEVLGFSPEEFQPQHGNGKNGDRKNGNGHNGNRRSR